MVKTAQISVKIVLIKIVSECLFGHPMLLFFTRIWTLYVTNMIMITYYDDDNVEEDRNIPQVGIAQGLLCLY